MTVSYLDPATGATYPLTSPRWCSDTGGPLMITEVKGLGRDEIERGRRSLWRYAAALPLSIARPVTMGEGMTPLVERTWRGSHVLFKLEWFAPTGSFKDRGAAVMISVLHQQGVDRILEDSSGNGGAAVAAYAAAAGIAAKILVPASTQLGKTVQIRAYGADVELVTGSRQDCADEAVRQSVGTFYASHNWQPFFLQGTKLLAYELWEDLGFRVPDNIVIPLGAGSSVLGCSIGFEELLRRGEIDQLPRLFGVQPENCAPLHASFLTGSETSAPADIRPTIAEGTAIARPLRGREVLTALRRCGGSTVAVSEQEIEAAVLDLAGTGFYVEPTAAVAAAAIPQLLGSGRIGSSDTTVVLLTGSGLKSSQRISEMLRT